MVSRVWKKQQWNWETSLHGMTSFRNSFLLQESLYKYLGITKTTDAISFWNFFKILNFQKFHWIFCRLKWKQTKLNIEWNYYSFLHYYSFYMSCNIAKSWKERDILRKNCIILSNIDNIQGLCGLYWIRNEYIWIDFNQYCF